MVVLGARENRDRLGRGIGDDHRRVRAHVSRSAERAAAAFGALLAPPHCDPVNAGQRPHPPRRAIEQRLSAIPARPAISPPTVPNASPNVPDEGTASNSTRPRGKLEGNVDKLVLVGQANAIGAGDPRRSAEAREQVAQVMQRLGLDEAAERLVDQGDVRLPEQMVDIFRRAQDDPVER